MKSIDPPAMSFGRRATAYAVIPALTCSIVLPLWLWYVDPLLQQPGRRGDRGRGLIIVSWVVTVVPFALFVTSVLSVGMPPSPWGFRCGAAGAVASGGLTLFGLNLFRNPAPRLDGEGILGYPSGGLGFHRRFVPWCEIASYSIETSRDDFGHGTKTALTLADSRAVTLLKVRPRPWPATDRERVERFFAAKFPRVAISDLGEL